MKKIICLLAAIVFLGFAASPAFAISPRLYFNSPELGVKQGDEFDVTIKIDTASFSVTGADAVLDYNPELLEVETIENGGFFSLFGKHYELSSQKIYITGFFTEKNQTKNGMGVFAKLTLKALKNGATSLQFSCVNKSLSDTNVINTAGDDMIVCSDLTPLQISISGDNFALAASSSFGKILGTESGSLITPTATLIPTPTTRVSTTSSLMETGVFDNAAFMIMFGSAFIVLGGFLLVYSRRELYY